MRPCPESTKPWTYGTAPGNAADAAGVAGRSRQPFRLSRRARSPTHAIDSKRRNPAKRNVLATLTQASQARSTTAALLQQGAAKWVKLGGHGVRGPVALARCCQKHSRPFCRAGKRWNNGKPSAKRAMWMCLAQRHFLPINAGHGQLMESECPTQRRLGRVWGRSSVDISRC